ncbi:hypothetical protein GIY30_07585 [Gordonia sp. HNM0687]|uniref:Uncharacterized protein n=1 Tax=Gordonia mangrovi TaxID=2665643 RepID=A0A6L7GRA6_9ACTN|nr:hypothetical protein [Gordonia mangrovi]MDY6811918.1 hypothetical protein [Actinomycetota bacterium]MXP21215.1 hypothetical protein [Gordonia mangrovi]UVF78255.1 hypothetical protein NWF22_24105 [Gordonia mangrovi]
MSEIPKTEVRGVDGESIVCDGITVSKFRHHGKDEAARNPVSTFRELQIKEKTSLFGKPRSPRQFAVLLVMSSIMSLTVDEAGKAAMEAMVDGFRR